MTSCMLSSRFVVKGYGRQAGSSDTAQRGGYHHLRDQRAKDKLIRREGLITLTTVFNPILHTLGC